MKNEKYRILHVEDVAADAELVRKELMKSNINFDYRVIDSEKEYLKELDSFSPDVILCDHTLPGFNSFEALKIVKEKKLYIPFLVITATMSEDVAMTIVREGADDYILKDRLKRLPHAVINAIEKFRFEKDRKQFVVEGYEKEALSKEVLRRLSNKLLLATKAAGVGIWEYYPRTGKFVGDEVMLTLCGLRAEDFDATFETWKKIIHPEDAGWVLEQFYNIYENEPVFNNAYKILYPDKSLHYIETSAIVEKDNDGISFRMIGTSRDVTDRKKSEQDIQINIVERELLIRELTKSITDLKQFTYITSHNFRAPLSNLIGLLGHIDYGTLTVANNKILEMFKISTLQLNNTINDLLKILIIKNNVNEDIANNNVSDLLNEVFNSLSSGIDETGCIISKDLAVEYIFFNKSYLESILINLISNAIKYRSQTRRLEINISTAHKLNGEILMVIKDNGIGIDLTMHHDKIFGLYQRFHTNTDSIGLGLFIVKSQINALGGNIEVQSEVDKGSSFLITFKQKKADEIA